MFFLPTLRNALWSLHPWPRSRSLCSLLFPWLLHWISQQLWKLSPSVTPPHRCTFMPLAWDVLFLLTYLANSCLLLKTQRRGPFLCDASHRYKRSSTPSPCPQRSWHRPLGKMVSEKRAVSATPQANSFNTVSLTPNSLVPVTFHPLGSWLHF